MSDSPNNVANTGPNPASNVSVDEDEDVLQVSTYDHEGVPVVRAEGDVDLCTAPSLKEALVSCCAEQTAPGTVAVDIREVPFIDSAGLALLVEIRKRFYETCRLALIIQKGSQPERVLKLGRFDTFLKVVYSPDDLGAVAPAAAA